MRIPTPEPGLVLNYAYLWHDEHRAGHEEGRKDRPSVIVFSVTRASNDATIVTVLPVTHATPADPEAAIEIPLGSKSISVLTTPAMQASPYRAIDIEPGRGLMPVRGVDL